MGYSNSGSATLRAELAALRTALEDAITAARNSVNNNVDSERSRIVTSVNNARDNVKSAVNAARDNVNGNLATVDGHVDSILEDTGTTLPAALVAVRDNIKDAAAADLDTERAAIVTSIEGARDEVQADVLESQHLAVLATIATGSMTSASYQDVLLANYLNDGSLAWKEIEADVGAGKYLIRNSNAAVQVGTGAVGEEVVFNTGSSVNNGYLWPPPLIPAGSRLVVRETQNFHWTIHALRFVSASELELD